MTDKGVTYKHLYVGINYLSICNTTMGKSDLPLCVAIHGNTTLKECITENSNTLHFVFRYYLR